MTLTTRQALAVTALHRMTDDGAGMTPGEHRRNPRPAPRRQGTRAAIIRAAMREG